MGKKSNKFVTVRNSAIVAASAAAAVASAWDRTHKHVTGAVLTESDLRVERLSDLRNETAMLDEIQSGLEREWGSFAFLGFKDVYEMAAEAGRTIFVVVERSEEETTARGIVQTTLADVHGDPELLEEAYPSFQSLTAPRSVEERPPARRRYGRLAPDHHPRPDRARRWHRLAPAQRRAQHATEAGAVRSHHDTRRRHED